MAGGLFSAASFAAVEEDPPSPGDGAPPGENEADDDEAETTPGLTTPGPENGVAADEDADDSEPVLLESKGSACCDPAAPPTLRPLPPLPNE